MLKMIDAESLLFSEIQFFLYIMGWRKLNICGEGNCFSGLAGFTLFFDLWAGPLPQ
jgi:hypothetical protein